MSIWIEKNDAKGVLSPKNLEVSDRDTGKSTRDDRNIEKPTPTANIETNVVSSKKSFFSNLLNYFNLKKWNEFDLVCERKKVIFFRLMSF